MSATMSHAVASLGPYELYMLTLSITSILLLAADSRLAADPDVHVVFEYADAGLCALFFADFLRSLKRAPDRKGYFLRSGWLDLISSVPTIGIFRLGRLARIARIVRLLRAMRSVRTIGQVIARHKAGSALSAAAIVSIVMVLFGSVAVLQFEQSTEANITSAGDAIWWAFATITTVGYGDRYPVTLEGRLVAGMLMAAGVGLFGTMSALVAAWFLEPERKAEEDQIALLRLDVARLSSLVESAHARPAPAGLTGPSSEDAAPAALD
jgi:voltage-gated potassium channel